MEKFASNAVVYEIEAPQAGSHLGTYIMVPEGEAAGWERRPPTVAERDPMPEAAPACREYAATVPLPEMGRGAEKELRRRLDTALTWARRHYSEEKGDFATFALAVARVAARRFFKQFGPRLKAELVDQQLRDTCLERGNSGLVVYIEFVREQLAKAQRFGRFRSQTEREEDLIADTVTKIVEIVRRGGKPLPFARYERAGVPAFVAIYDEVRAGTRRLRRLTLVGRPIDLPTGAFPSAEDVLLEKERHAALEALPAKLAQRLTRRQQAWLAAFQLAAEEGNWILLDAASDFGVHRSQATRAAKRIAAVARRFKLLDDVTDK